MLQTKLTDFQESKIFEFGTLEQTHPFFRKMLEEYVGIGLKAGWVATLRGICKLAKDEKEDLFTVLNATVLEEVSHHLGYKHNIPDKAGLAEVAKAHQHDWKFFKRIVSEVEV